MRLVNSIDPKVSDKAWTGHDAHRVAPTFHISDSVRSNLSSFDEELFTIPSWTVHLGHVFGILQFQLF